MADITISLREVKKLKTECEEEIRRLLIELQDKTGLDIVTIRAESTTIHTVGSMDKQVIDKVELRLEV